MVYIQEAHPSNAWQLESNVKDGVIFADPMSTDERSDVAGLCVLRLSIRLPALIDNIGNSTVNAK